MLQYKHYMDIENMSLKHAEKFLEGDHIIIQEKIDGANVSFQYDEETDSVQCFSRNQPVDAENPFRGYYDWVQQLDKDQVHAALGNHLRMFGEWLVPHRVVYPEEKQNTMYCFDIYDTEKAAYLPQDKVKHIVEQLGLHYVPVFYEGAFTSWDDIMPLVGKTEMGAELGEGIVIKNMTTRKHGMYYVKLVHERFAEIHKQKRKPLDLEKIREREHYREIVKTIVTPQRVEKLLYKLVDEGVVPENFTMEDMKTICRSLPSAVYYDCVKEHPEIVEQIENFGKYSGSLTIPLVKEIIRKKCGSEQS